MAKSEKLPLSPMLVQYLVGLCALKWDASAVDVDVMLGDMVPDVGSGTSRDVDVTVTVDAADGVYAFKCYEVKHWSKPLDVSDVDSLVTKFNDMPSVTHRAIVSSSGYSEAAVTKAAHHGIDLYAFKPWDRPLAEQFPDLAPMSGLPAEHIRTLALNLIWPWEHQKYWLGVDSPPFEVAREAALLDANGEVHSVYPTFGTYAEAMVLRSTNILVGLDPIRELTAPLQAAHHARVPMPSEPQWPYAHTLDVARDEVFIRASDEKLYSVNTFTLYGVLKWEALQVVYTVLEKVPSGEAFAGAVVAPTDVPGDMWAIVFPAAGRELTTTRVRLEPRHLNSIRNLKIATGESPDP
jgi:hypothetical protein